MSPYYPRRVYRICSIASVWFPMWQFVSSLCFSEQVQSGIYQFHLNFFFNEPAMDFIHVIFCLFFIPLISTFMFITSFLFFGLVCSLHPPPTHPTHQHFKLKVWMIFLSYTPQMLPGCVFILIQLKIFLTSLMISSSTHMLLEACYLIFKYLEIFFRYSSVVFLLNSAVGQSINFV